MSKSNRFSPEVRERAVRLVQEHRGEHRSLWAAIESNGFLEDSIDCSRPRVESGVDPEKQ